MKSASKVHIRASAKNNVTKPPTTQRILPVEQHLLALTAHSKNKTHTTKWVALFGM